MKTTSLYLALVIGLGALATPSHAQDCLGSYSELYTSGSPSSTVADTAIDQNNQVALVVTDSFTASGGSTEIQVFTLSGTGMEWDITAVIPTATPLWNPRIDIEGSVIVLSGRTGPSSIAPFETHVYLRDNLLGYWSYGVDLGAAGLAYHDSGATTACGLSAPFSLIQVGHPSSEFGFSTTMTTVAGQVMVHVGDPRYRNVCLTLCAGCPTTLLEDGAVWTFAVTPPTAGAGASATGVGVVQRIIPPNNFPGNFPLTQARFGAAVASCPSANSNRGRLIVGAPQERTNFVNAGGLLSGGIHIFDTVPLGMGFSFPLRFTTPGQAPTILGIEVAIQDRWAFSGGPGPASSVYQRPAGAFSWMALASALPISRPSIDESAQQLVGSSAPGVTVHYSLSGAGTWVLRRGTTSKPPGRTTSALGAASTNSILRFDCGGFLENYDFGTQASDVTPLNSLGGVAKVDLTGSYYAGDNNLTLTATEIPPNSLSFFITSKMRRTSPVGGVGIYLFGSIGYLFPAASSGPSGSIQTTLDLTMIPASPAGGFYSAMVGESIYFQLAHRDIDPANPSVPVFRFSELVGYPFQ